MQMHLVQHICSQPKLLRQQLAEPTKPRHQRSAHQFRAQKHHIKSRQSCRNAICQAAAREGELSIADLEAQLGAAISCEDFGLAATLRDSLKELRSDGEGAVKEANRAFYAAFQRGSFQDMSAVWGNGEHVQCIHPMAGCIAGRQDVLESWRLVLGNGGYDSIHLEDERIHVGGNTAYVTCMEIVQAGGSKGRILATNVFEKQDGVWKIVHHHGSVPPMENAGMIRL